jgi:hypothetical protein
MTMRTRILRERAVGRTPCCPPPECVVDDVARPGDLISTRAAPGVGMGTTRRIWQPEDVMHWSIEGLGRQHQHEIGAR